MCKEKLFIKEYKFGEVKVGNKCYYNDIIILPVKIITNWWRKEGHLLLPEDLKEVINSGISILIIGKGYSSCMVVPDNTIKYLSEYKIKAIPLDSISACKEFNHLLKEGKKIGLCLHLTC